MVLFLGHGRMFTARASPMHSDAENHIHSNQPHTGMHYNQQFSLESSHAWGFVYIGNIFLRWCFGAFHILILETWYQTPWGTLSYWYSMRQNYQKRQQPVSHFHNSVFILLFIALSHCITYLNISQNRMKERVQAGSRINI